MSMRAVVAADVGGTHVSAATVDVGSADVARATRRRSELPAGSSRRDLLHRICGTVASARSGDIEAAAVAVPGPFDYARGICLLEHKLAALYGVDLRAELSQALSLPPEAVVFVNDAEAFVLGEWWAGAARGHERVIGVTIGSGLGSAFLDGGRVVRESPRVPPEGELYRLSLRGSPVEDHVSGRAIVVRYGVDGLDVADIAERGRGGDRRALGAFADVASDLAEVLRPWVIAFAPSCVVVGGSISRAWDLLREGLRALEPHVDTVFPAQLVDDASLLGAAYHAASERAP